MTVSINTKLGFNRNSVARIWLEGFKLEREGIRPSMSYSMRHDRETKSFVVVMKHGSVDDPHAIKSGTVSRRKVRGEEGKYLPLIEIASHEFKKAFSDYPVRIVITGLTITISIARAAKDLMERILRFKNRIARGEPLRTISQFHGGGVMDLAVHCGLAKHKIASYVRLAFELEPRYIDSSLRNNPELWRADSAIFEGSIENFNPTGCSVPQCEILIAGMPCTAHSLAGRAKKQPEHAEDDEKAGHMLIYFLMGALATNPVMILLENVKQLQTSPSMSIIRNVLRSRHYRLSEAVIHGNDFGSLEGRERLYMVAVSEGMPEPNLAFVSGEKSRPASVEEILDEDDGEGYLDMNYLLKKELRDQQKGSNFKAMLVEPTATSLPVMCKGYSKVRSGEPYLAHPDRTLRGVARKFTAKEHARIKTIPESLIDGLSETIAHEILGQSVIFEVVRCLMGHLAKQWLTWLGWSERGASRGERTRCQDHAIAA